jgi:hypothetical protein
MSEFFRGWRRKLGLHPVESAPRRIESLQDASASVEEKHGRTMSVFGVLRRIVLARPNTALAILGLSLAILPGIVLTNLKQFTDFLADCGIGGILLNRPLMDLLGFGAGLLACYGLAISLAAVLRATRPSSPEHETQSDV